VEVLDDRVGVTIPGGGRVEANPILVSLVARHPEATLHFGKHPHKGPLYLALKNSIVATCAILPTQSVEVPEEKKKK
jgi:hypothetical protein